jgi:uncharacterized protein YjdB
MKVQISNFKFQLMLLVCLFAFYSCDKIDDAATTDVKVSSVTFELDDILVEENSTKSTLDDELNVFSATQTILLSDLQGLSDDAIKHASKIESVEVGEASIMITTTDSVGTVVKEFVLQVTGISSSIGIAQYDLGTTYLGENMQDFVNQLLLKLFISKEAELTASGKTDITSGEKLKVKITLEDITLVAGLLN